MPQGIRQKPGRSRSGSCEYRVFADLGWRDGWHGLPERGATESLVHPLTEIAAKAQFT